MYFLFLTFNMILKFSSPKSCDFMLIFFLKNYFMFYYFNPFFFFPTGPQHTEFPSQEADPKLQLQPKLQLWQCRSLTYSARLGIERVSQNSQDLALIRLHHSRNSYFNASLSFNSQLIVTIIEK